MNILFYNWNSNSEDDLCEAFAQLGFDYTRFYCSLKDYENDSNFYDECIKVLRTQNYDCIFSFDYFPILSKAAASEKIVYISWIYDCPHYTLYSDTIYNSCNRIFFFDRMQCMYFIEKGLKNGFHMPLGVNSRKLNKLLGTDVTQVDYLHDICFAGSLYNQNMYNQINYLPQYIKGYLDGIMNSQKNIYGYDFLPELITDDIVEEINKYINFDDELGIPYKRFYADLIYTKIAELERMEVLNVCSECAETAIYTSSVGDKIKNIKFMPAVSYYPELPVIYRKSKVNLNITCRTVGSGIPLRALDIMGSGGFLLSNYQQELADYFVPDKEIVLYESMSDLRYKVQYYLEHEEERIAITQNGQRKVQELFSYDKILEKIFKIGLNL